MVRRIKRLRIFPEICARTRCSFASSTRNIVPARTEMIFPSSSIAFLGSMMLDRVSCAQSMSAGSARSDYLPPLPAEWARTLFACARLVYVQRSPADFLAVERGHRSVGFGRVGHGDERETARLASHAIHHQRHFGDFAVFFEKILKIVFGSLKGEISYIQFHCDLILENNCQLQSRSRESGFKSPLRKPQLTIYHATNRTELNPMASNLVAFPGNTTDNCRKLRAWRDSNPQPSDPKSDALSG